MGRRAAALTAKRQPRGRPPRTPVAAVAPVSSARRRGRPPKVRPVEPVAVPSTAWVRAGEPRAQSGRRIVLLGRRGRALSRRA